MKKKLLFLDVDGVLNHDAIYSSEHFDGTKTLDPDCCDQLGRIVDECAPVHVVLSSTWRFGNDEKLNKLKEWLRKCNVCIFSATGRDINGFRGHEIDEWVMDHPEFIGATYVILDDDSDFTEFQLPYLVQTNFYDGGLTAEKANQAIDILNR